MGQILKMVEVFKTFNNASGGSPTNGESNAKNENVETVKREHDIQKPKSNSEIYKENTIRLAQNGEERVTKYFDDPIHTNSIKNLKAMIPYVDAQYQKNLAIFIKLIELQKVVEMYDSQEVSILSVGEGDGTDWRRGMLAAVRNHSSEDKQQMIDMIMSLMDIKEVMDKMKGE